MGKLVCVDSQFALASLTVVPYTQATSESETHTEKEEELKMQQQQQASSPHEEKVRELKAELVATDGQIQALDPHLVLDTLEERCELQT